MSPDAIAGFVALGAGPVVLTTQRAINPAVPAIAAPIAVAWPHGAPALGAGVALGALTLARPRRMPGPAFLAVLAFGVMIAVDGDGGLVRGAAAAIAVAIVTPAYVRTLEDLVVAGTGFGLAAGAVALGAGVTGVHGVRADLIAVGAAAGLAAAGGVGARAVCAVDLAGVLVLPSRVGAIAAAVAIIGLLLVRRLPPLDAILAGIATGLAWIAGLPFAHAHLRHLNAFSDTYHRLGVMGVALFGVLLVTTVWGLPRPYAPGLLAAAVGAVFVPIEATAPLWLLAGFAAIGGSPEGPLPHAGVGERVYEWEREVEDARRVLADEHAKLRRRRLALDDREAKLAERERELEAGTALAPPSPPPPPPPTPPPPVVEPPPVAPPPPVVEPEPEPEIVEPEVFIREPEPEPEPEPVAPLVLQPRPGCWSLAALTRLIDERAARYPEDLVDEWRVYLDAFAPQAENGVLTPKFDLLVYEVFGRLIEDAESG